jgi:hypothetical protein
MLMKVQGAMDLCINFKLNQQSHAVVSLIKATGGHA